MSEDWGAGGTGGSAVLSVAGMVSVDSSAIQVSGGSAGQGNNQTGSAGSQGGNATASLTSLVMTSNSFAANSAIGTRSSFSLAGGNGAVEFGDGNGGNGGQALLTLTGSGSVDSSDLEVAGGGGGSYDGYDKLGGPGTGGIAGNGGDGTVSASLGLTLTAANQSATLRVSGGGGGTGSEAGNAVPGVGGSGGTGSLEAGPVSIDSSTLQVLGGVGGAGNGQSGVTEGMGGDSNAMVQGSLVLTSNQYFTHSGVGASSNLILGGGSGGSDLNLGQGGTAVRRP